MKPFENGLKKLFLVSSDTRRENCKNKHTLKWQNKLERMAFFECRNYLQVSGLLENISKVFSLSVLIVKKESIFL